MRIAFVKTSERRFEPALRKILQRRGEGEKRVLGRVEEIVRGVRALGDRALMRYTRLFDNVRLQRVELEVPKAQIQEALNSTPKKDLRVMQAAAARIARFHRRQLEKSWRYRDSLGLVLGQKLTPLERVGVYVPGGKAAYPSTVLMNVIPAKVAGVREIIMTSPIGNQANAVLAAAAIAGVDRIFRVGGAQAIAALAFGTQSIPRVDKIVGPGNVYVAAAKRLVFGEVDIDSIAGPSEILILADPGAEPAFVAADMLSQAEHDELAAAFCITPSLPLAYRIKAALEKEIQNTKRRAITLRALERYGAIIVSRGMKEAVEIANQIAPEHIALMMRKPESWVPAIRNAGAIFVGAYSTAPLGDYMAGPNHVLPTGGSARFFSPLGSYDFIKRTSVIRADKKALKALAPAIIHMASMEGLDDHARAVEARFKKGVGNGANG
jgi:histidinol dehydrogenase